MMILPVLSDKFLNLLALSSWYSNVSVLQSSEHFHRLLFLQHLFEMRLQEKELRNDIDNLVEYHKERIYNSQLSTFASLGVFMDKQFIIGSTAYASTIAVFTCNGSRRQRSFAASRQS
jgi:hypothetical protein